MPYIAEPMWAKRSERSLNTLMYLATFMCGFMALIFTPLTIANELTTFLTMGWGVLVMIGSVPAIYGVFTGRYRFEFSALPWIIAGIAIYASTVISILPESITRGAQASALIALVFALSVRMLKLVVTTIKMNRMHEIEVNEE